MSVTLYGVCASPFVRKVLIVAESLDLDFEHVTVYPFKLPEDFHQISPLGKVPALTDGDLSLADSSAICDYLANRYGNGRFYPADPADRARVLWFEEFADTKLLEALGVVFFEKLVKPGLLKQPTDEARIEGAMAQQPGLFDYLESQLPEQGYIIGDELTLADIAIGTQFANARFVGLTPDPQKWPKLAAYIDMLRALPCFEKRAAEDQAHLSKVTASAG